MVVVRGPPGQDLEVKEVLKRYGQEEMDDESFRCSSVASLLDPPQPLNPSNAFLPTPSFAHPHILQLQVNTVQRLLLEFV